MKNDGREFLYSLLVTIATFIMERSESWICIEDSEEMYCPQVSVSGFIGLRKTFLFARGKESLKKKTSILFWSSHILHFYWSFQFFPQLSHKEDVTTEIV